MGTAERRVALLHTLCRRRHDQIGNLALEFGVSERTIRRDVEILSRTYPVYTQQGRWGGGVYIVEQYRFDRLYMHDEEIAVLQKVLVAARDDTWLTPQEKQILQLMISLYKRPLPQKGKNNDRL